MMDVCACVSENLVYVFVDRNSRQRLFRFKPPVCVISRQSDLVLRDIKLKVEMSSYQGVCLLRLSNSSGYNSSSI